MLGSVLMKTVSKFASQMEFRCSCGVIGSFVLNEILMFIRKFRRIIARRMTPSVRRRFVFPRIRYAH